MQGFQFTHPCGCDHFPRMTFSGVRGFNSRTRVGATRTTLRNLIALVVSIHAPVWVRRVAIQHTADSSPFQFTHPCGCDREWAGHQRAQFVSIHAPVWVRPLLLVLLFVRAGFNSRTRVGATDADIKIRAYIDSFNSRTRVGATIQKVSIRVESKSFNSRTRVGATGRNRRSRGNCAVSIHAPVWVRRPDEYGLSIKHATKVLRQPDARTRCGQA